MKGVIKDRREEMSREAWIKNVMRIYPSKTRAEVEKLHDLIFDKKTIQS